MAEGNPSTNSGTTNTSSSSSSSSGSNASTTSSSGTSTGSTNNRTSCSLPNSPPKAEVDETPIQKTMDKNKESLKVKLMLRRPIAQLVDQGILPSLKTPPAFHEQRQKLERAKMGDLLKNKIQRRPDRQELIQQHILEDSNVDPSLQDRQRQLKKARLADDLNDRLSHRPGPLELIKGNILKTDEQFAQAVKEGQISFKKTCEGETRKHPPPMFVFDEDSSSEGAQSPLQDSDQSQVGSVPSSGDCPVPVATPNVIVNNNINNNIINNNNNNLPSSTASSLSPLSSISSPSSLAFSPGTVTTNVVMIPNAVTSPTGRSSCSSKSESGKDSSRSRKKSKSKSQPKTRTIKFHEYKGPPNAQKNQQASPSSVESSYDLLLQQQQLFLQWQLEWQHKYPQIILPSSQKVGENLNAQSSSITPTMVPSNGNGMSTANAVVTQASLQPQVEQNRCLSKLEEMKVSDLKAELKKRNLPVSGSKPQLIQRLRPYSDVTTNSLTNVTATGATESSAINNGTAHPSALVTALLDSSPPSGSPEDPSMNLDVPMSPVIKKEVNNNTLTACCMSPDNSQDGSTTTTPRQGSFSNPSATAVPASTTTRPPSVAPMDVDVNCNAGFDAMDISEGVVAGGGGGSQPLVFTPIVNTTTAAATVATATPVAAVLTASNGVSSSDNEEILRKKIEELQRELQRECEMLQPQQENSPFGSYHFVRNRSQMQLQQQQTPPATSLLIQPQPQQEVVPQAQVPQKPAIAKPVNSAVPGATDSRTQQRLLMHLQQKIQQQQQQQQQQQGRGSVTNTSAAPATNAKANLAAFLQNQGPNVVANNMLAVNKGFLNNAHQQQQQQQQQQQHQGSPNVTLNNVDQQGYLNQRNVQKQQQQQARNGRQLPNGFTQHQRSGLKNKQQNAAKAATLPSFGLISPAKAPIIRIASDSHFNKPPPDYTEATKQLNKVKQEQFAQSLLSDLIHIPGQKSVKCQAVDDVLEVLIENGELPPSAAQDPATPTTPKSLPSTILYTTASSISTPSHPLKMVASHSAPHTQTASRMVTTTVPHVIMTSALKASPPPPPPPPPPPLPSLIPLKLNTNQLPIPSLGDVGLGSPDLEVNLDLDGLEAMDINQLTVDVSGLPPVSGSGELSDPMHMDIDVSDWLDVIMPPPTTTMMTMATPTTSGSANDCPDSGDPLLSNNQDPFDLFTIDENDFKTDLNVLNWDKVDFAT